MNKMNKMNIQAAKSATEFVRIVSRDREGRASYLEVPGHKGARYNVKLKRNGLLTSHCYIDRGGMGNADCPSRHICYHTLAAVAAAAEDVGMTVVWCNSLDDAKRLSNLGGQWFSVTNQFGNRAYGVVR